VLEPRALHSHGWWSQTGAFMGTSRRNSRGRGIGRGERRPRMGTGAPPSASAGPSNGTRQTEERQFASGGKTEFLQLR